MRNRPLLCVCLLLLFTISIATIGGGEKFIKELRPSPIEQYAEAEENITVQGTIYRQEQKETYQKIYLNHNSIIKFQKTNHKIKIKENKILIYLKSNQKLHIGNEVKITGEVSFFDKARNPGNFDQKFYYQKQDIHACVWAENAEVISTKTDALKDCLAEFRMRWKALLEKELGERGGAILAAVLLGEKSDMDQEVKELYQANGIGHILAISGVKTLKLDIPLVLETRINWAFVPLHIAIIYILKLCLDEEIIPRCRFPCSRGYFKKCINWQNKKSFSVSQSYRKSLKNQQKEK